MEEAGSLDSRRVIKEYVPQRVADEILTLAYKWITSQESSTGTDDDSVQVRPKKECAKTDSLQEVMR